MRKILFLLILPLLGYSQSEALEMKSNTEGFSLGLTGNTLGWSSTFFTVLDDLEPSGYGLGLEAGYGFTQRLELIARFDYSSLAIENSWDYFDFSNLDLMARFNMGSTTRKFRPYFELGAGRQAMNVSPLLLNNEVVSYELSGVGIAYGAGLNFFITRHLLATLNASGTLGKMQKFTVNESEPILEVADVNNFRIRLGMRFYFKDL